MSDHAPSALDVAKLRKNGDSNQLKHNFRARDVSSSNNVWNLCSSCCFLFEKCGRDGAARGAWEREIVNTFRVGWHFAHLFFWHPSLHSIQIVSGHGGWQEPHRWFVYELFSEKKEHRKLHFNCTSAHGLLVCPRRGTPKAAQNYVSERTDSRNVFSTKRKALPSSRDNHTEGFGAINRLIHRN